MKPYAVLSNGEKFRCDLARALVMAPEGSIVGFDEFTSVVDRVVAKACSASVRKLMESGLIKCRLLVVSCHYDIVEWLCPEWVVDMATCQLARGRLHRPEIHLEIFRCDRSAWSLFAKHHYLGSDLHRAAVCYLATWNGEPVAFCAMLHNFGHVNYDRISRIVTLPDYQGLGIGTRVAEACAQIHKDMGKRVSIIASHPAIVRHCEKSPLWRLTGVKPGGSNPQSAKLSNGRHRAVSTNRSVVGFEFVGKR